jgi:hypothetical protein
MLWLLQHREGFPNSHWLEDREGIITMLDVMMEKNVPCPFWELNFSY